MSEPVARPHPEHVVLDIGEDVGALVIHADPELHDLQIEICRSGEEDGKREHQHILERPIGGRTMYAAVFGGLHEGAYTLLTNNAIRERDVAISGAEVTTLDWRTS
ncbi:MAG: hypothetical protein QOJ25_435 [Solirubrobacteraceae bacterium]|nr:hypothetical protein [Solirubrobacteraceae bacterium]